MVVCGMLRDFCSTNGMFNLIRGLFGLESYNLLSNPGLYRTIHIGSGVWQTVGWNSIIYLATISTIDPQQYEAAYLDGANVLQRILHITLPALLPIISVQFIMRIGNIMSVGYEKVILLSNSLTLETADVISSYLYRTGILKGKYSMATAVGLFNLSSILSSWSSSIKCLTVHPKTDYGKKGSSLIWQSSTAKQKGKKYWKSSMFLYFAC